MIAAFISAISNAVEVILDKIIVGEKNMTGMIFFKISFLFLALWMILPVILWGSISTTFFTPLYLIVFAIMLVVAMLHNYFYYTALQHKPVCEVEPITLLSMPITILFAMLIFPIERNLSIFIITIAATAVLLASRLEKKHLDFDKYSWYLILHDLFIAGEAILIKLMLNVTNAVSLYGIRVICIAIVFILFFRSVKVDRVSKKEYLQTFLTQGVVSLEFVTKFFAIAMLGVVKSSLILLLGPVLILLFSNLFLKEKITLRRGIGDAIIVMLVAVTIFV